MRIKKSSAFAIIALLASQAQAAVDTQIYQDQQKWERTPFTVENFESSGGAALTAAGDVRFLGVGILDDARTEIQVPASANEIQNMSSSGTLGACLGPNFKQSKGKYLLSAHINPFASERVVSVKGSRRRFAEAFVNRVTMGALTARVHIDAGESTAFYGIDPVLAHDGLSAYERKVESLINGQLAAQASRLSSVGDAVLDLSELPWFACDLIQETATLRFEGAANSEYGILPVTQIYSSSQLAKIGSALTDNEKRNLTSPSAIGKLLFSAMRLGGSLVDAGVSFDAMNVDRLTRLLNAFYEIDWRSLSVTMRPLSNSRIQEIKDETAELQVPSTNVMSTKVDVRLDHIVVTPGK